MARGGLKKMTVNFKGCDETLEKIFGANPSYSDDKKDLGIHKKEQINEKKLVLFAF
ncbi:hypothetical protein ACFL52_04605 [Candidatus Margulisiibacteriota bacterium]